MTDTTQVLEEPAHYTTTHRAYDLIPSDLRAEYCPRQSDLQSIVNHLLQAEWLEHGDEGYRFICDLWRLWIREYYPL